MGKPGDNENENGGLVAANAATIDGGLEQDRAGSLGDMDMASRLTNFHLLDNDRICARIATHPYFQNMTLIVIVVNAIWIGIEVDGNHPNMKRESTETFPRVALAVENTFCVFFSIELSIRFFAYKRKLDFFKDRWNVFDGLLVLFMVIETWILAIIAAIVGGGSDGPLSKLSALRLLRLLRLTRMARIMKEVPELLTLVKGMVSATKAVSFILMFLLLVMYVFAIILTAQFGDPDAPEHKYLEQYYITGADPTAVELFGSIGDSMMTLFTQGMLADNLAQCLIAIKDAGDDMTCELVLDDNNVTVFDAEICVRSGGSFKSLMLMWVFIIFVIISAFCLLNMLIGVLCEVIQDSAEKENESTQISELKHHMQQAFQMIDTSNDGKITAKEWTLMKTQGTVRASMANLGVEEQHMDESLDQMQESLFGSREEDEEEEEEMDSPGAVRCISSDRGGLTFDQFIEKVVEIRPDTPASALDIELLRVRVEREEKILNARIDLIEQALTNVTASPASIQAVVKPAEPALGSGPPQAEWLREVPTEVLFQVLQNRAPPEVGPPKLLDPKG